MDDSPHAFRAETQSICKRYLEQFPEETERLGALLGYLDDSALDLRLRSTIPQGHVCSSGLLLLPGGKLLMLRHKSLGIWVVPGGHYDITDGAIYNAALRETVEETGLKLSLKLHPWHLQMGIPLDIDTHPIPRNDKKNEAAHQHFDFRYLLVAEDPGQVIDQLALDEHEVTGFAEVPLSDVDPTSSIAPAVAKLHHLLETL